MGKGKQYWAVQTGSEEQYEGEAEVHVSCTRVACEWHVSCMWVACECMWAACELHVSGMRGPCELHESACELHVRSMWAAWEVHVSCMWGPCELHVRSMWAAWECMWAACRVACELHESGMWAACRVACELHESGMWAACELHESGMWAACRVASSQYQQLSDHWQVMAGVLGSISQWLLTFCNKTWVRAALTLGWQKKRCRTHTHTCYDCRFSMERALQIPPCLFLILRPSVSWGSLFQEWSPW